MGVRVQVPRDLTRVKSKILFNLTKRQLLCFGSAALIGLPTFFLLKETGNVSLAVVGMMIIMLPLFFLAMYEKDGQPLEIIAKHYIETKFIKPKIRPYKTDNYYSALMRQKRLEQEVEAIVFNISKKEKGRRNKSAKQSHKSTAKRD
ncbi:PrgI family protein [Clostridium sp. C45]|uniref:PrgI family protein n=1 Tax=Clostridium sp. 10cd* TaxID=3373596 RepID=UPI0037C18A8E